MNSAQPETRPRPGAMARIVCWWRQQAEQRAIEREALDAEERLCAAPVTLPVVGEMACWWEP